jgi:hypothetical protein
MRLHLLQVVVVVAPVDRAQLHKLQQITQQQIQLLAQMESTVVLAEIRMVVELAVVVEVGMAVLPVF